MMPSPATEFEHVLADHKHLNELFSQIRTLLATDQPNQQELTALLYELKVQILEHFAHEEQKGLFERIASLAPRLSEEAMELKAQHQALAVSLELILQPVTQSTWGVEQVREIAKRFNEFSLQFGEHEEGENRLLQETYDRDVGSKD